MDPSLQLTTVVEKASREIIANQKIIKDNIVKAKNNLLEI